MKILLSKFVPAAIILLALPVLSASAGEKPFPKRVPVLDGSYHEGFTIGKGHTGYSGSPDGSIYKVDLRSGKGEVLVPAEVPFDPDNDCYKLGMRVDPRTNYLFVAGCVFSNAYVFDADTGALIMEYQLTPDFAIINDLAITKEAVYFTDSYEPFLYRLPLSKNGGLPADSSGVTKIPLSPFEIGDYYGDGCCAANGIVATPNGKTLIVGNSTNSTILRVDPATGQTDEISVDPPLTGFLDGIVFRGGILYILTPYDPDPEDMIQVVALDKDMLSGTLLGVIRDDDLDGVASGALFGNSLYVNNARYNDYPELDTEYWITKLSIYDVE
jgi:hypothetical protein